jgi:hypothetical protein
MTMLEPLDIYLLLFCRVLVGAVFLLAVIGKVRDLTAFRDAVATLVGVPTRAARALSIGVVAAEATVTMLMFGGTPQFTVGFGAALVMLSAFSLVLGTAVVRGRRVACNCFGGRAKPVTGADLARNVVLIACAGAGLALVGGGASAGPFALADGALTTLMALVCVLLVVTVADLVMLARPTPRALESPEEFR